MRRRQPILAALLISAAMPLAAEPLPVDRFIGDILANPADAATISARCDAVLEEINRRRAELEGETGPATVAGTLQRYDDLYNLHYASTGEFQLLREVMLDEARREAAGSCEVRLISSASAMKLSRPVYDRLKAIDATQTDPATRHYLARELASFEREGVALDEAARREVQAIQGELARISTDFEQGIANGRKVVSADPAELDGLPADFIAAHAPGADGKVSISTDRPEFIPVMTYAKGDALRQRLYEASMTRAYPENDVRLRRILELRQQLASKLGRADYAALVLEDRMLKTPAAVERLMADMAAAARPAGMADYAKKLAVLQQMQPGATEIKPWQSNYLGQIVQKQDYAYDRQAARAYFTYDRSRDGILRLAQDLFGVEIRPWQTTTWHPDVEAYELFDKGVLIGRFYFDSHPRPGKFSHGNMVPLRAGIRGRTIPVAALVMNLPKGDHATGLMEHGDVLTLLHEFGHLIHGLLSPADRWAAISGISGEWDFAEAPSQMLEEWVYDYDTLARFAVNAEGQPIPRELVATMNRTRYFDLGLSQLRQMGFANISLGLHRGLPPADLGAATRQLYGEYDLVPLSETAQLQASFGHLTGYSATYYTYLWSKVIADDMFSRFRANGLRDQATAERYRRMVLEPGGSKPAAQLVEEFLGRPISLEAYQAELAKDR